MRPAARQVQDTIRMFDHRAQTPDRIAVLILRILSRRFRHSGVWRPR
jgi:hypothetical protein